MKERADATKILLKWNISHLKNNKNQWHFAYHFHKYLRYKIVPTSRTVPHSTIRYSRSEGKKKAYLEFKRSRDRRYWDGRYWYGQIRLHSCHKKVTYIPHWSYLILSPTVIGGHRYWTLYRNIRY
jgi:hypothetical protein